MSSPFLSQTVSDWISLAAIAGCVMLLLLFKVNYFCMRAAKRQAKAATEQAAIALLAAQLAKERADSAKQSLDEMMHWAEVARTLRKETAVETLEVLSRSARNWVSGLLDEETYPATILPRAFDEVMAFLMLQFPSMQEEIRQFQGKVEATENTLVAFMEKPLSAREIAPRISLTLGNRLEQVAVAAETIGRKIQALGFGSPSESEQSRLVHF